MHTNVLDSFIFVYRVHFSIMFITSAFENYNSSVFSWVTPGIANSFGQIIFQNRYKLTEKLAIKSLRNNCAEMLEFYRTKELRQLIFPKRLRDNSLNPKLVNKPSSWLVREGMKKSYETKTKKTHKTVLILL